MTTKKKPKQKKMCLWFCVKEVFAGRKGVLLRKREWSGGTTREEE